MWFFAMEMNRFSQFFLFLANRFEVFFFFCNTLYRMIFAQYKKLSYFTFHSTVLNPLYRLTSVLIGLKNSILSLSVTIKYCVSTNM